ncbi:hypothetical protein ALC60_11410 [Trachymyrmex zeteki]|uniref:CCHC-type domain-containing protein n=1 Tax=Mycetomoellerius zeteki TaxID=64791 RepID=A0A151WNS4_9HYME|nr:hypothetical protein ALC60_11410 [Trachymyrmex zeteki]
MDTRSKKTANDPSTETHDAKAGELATREFELQQIERALQERERRMKQHEVAHEQRATAMEHDRRTLDRERDQMISKISELEVREKEVEKRWQDFETTRLEDSASNIPAHSTPHKPNHLDRYNYPRETLGRRDYSYDVRNQRFDRNRDNTRNEFNRNNDRRTNDRAEQSVCKYCKNFGHTIDECRKRLHNNSQHERLGNLSGPSGHRSQNPTDEKRNTRPIRIVETEEKETERPTEPESQSKILYNFHTRPRSH